MERWRKKKKATSDRLGTHLIYCEGITISIADPPEIPINSYNYPSHEKKKKSHLVNPDLCLVSVFLVKILLSLCVY